MREAGIVEPEEIDVVGLHEVGGIVKAARYRGAEIGAIVEEGPST